MAARSGSSLSGDAARCGEAAPCWSTHTGRAPRYDDLSVSNES